LTGLRGCEYGVLRGIARSDCQVQGVVESPGLASSCKAGRPWCGREQNKLAHSSLLAARGSGWGGGLFGGSPPLSTDLHRKGGALGCGLASGDGCGRAIAKRRILDALGERETEKKKKKARCEFASLLSMRRLESGVGVDGQWAVRSIVVCGRSRYGRRWVDVSGACEVAGLLACWCGSKGKVDGGQAPLLLCGVFWWLLRCDLFVSFFLFFGKVGGGRFVVDGTTVLGASCSIARFLCDAGVRMRELGERRAGRRG
jgi:hypothetical protein